MSTLQKKTICILTPVYKRPEIVKIFLEGFQRIKRYYKNLILVCIVSREDPYAYPTDPRRKSTVDMIFEAGGEVCEYSNKYLGEKKNAGLEFALDMKWDYMMELGSDNLVNPALFDLYEPYMSRKERFFGLNNLYVMEWATKRTIFLEKYNTLHTYGAGRMLLNECITIHPWTDQLQEGLDTNAMKRLRDIGVKETVIDVGTTPMILDIKTNTNISHWLQIEPLKLRELEFSEISEHFGIPVYPEAIMTLNTFEGFNTYLYDMKKQYGYTYKKAYEETEKVHTMHFRMRKFKNYDSYKATKSQKK